MRLKWDQDMRQKWDLPHRTKVGQGHGNLMGSENAVENFQMCLGHNVSSKAANAQSHNLNCGFLNDDIKQK
jgi:hypothetical protein